MAPVAKWIFISLSVAMLVGATLALRNGTSSPSPAPTLTPSQLAELKPSPAPEPPKATLKPVNDPSNLPPPPEEEPEVEDGSGS